MMNVYASPHEVHHIKRPLNSFMVWAKEKRRMMNKKNPKMRNADISKILGEEWRKMAEKDKQPYVQQAVYLRRQHKIDYPNYRYRPRRKNNQDPRVERPGLDRAASYSRVFSNVYLPLPSSNTVLRGTCVPYSYDSIMPSRYTMDRLPLDIPSPGISFPPKLISPYTPSYLIPSSEMAVKDYSSSSSPCLSNASISPQSVLKDGPLQLPIPGTSSYSTAVPYVMLPSKSQFQC
ncbi:hypothetical protein QZH41_003656 [Actinostola sp. cb2023]|nr:hypothetical protein QZH41_003656 [Actinostola sp. cb2023]